MPTISGATAAAFGLAFALSALLGGRLIGLLRRVGARQTVSADAPAGHAAKQGTPTMGGVLILAGLSFPVILEVAVHPWHLAALGLLALTLGFGLIGFLDDYLIARRGKNLGLKARQKLALQFVGAVAWVLWLRAGSLVGPNEPTATMVRFGDWAADLGVWYYPLAVVFIVGLSNAVNLMDGLDGLAGGVCAILAVALAATVTPVGGWLPLFAAAMAGGCLGFLWYNSHPAQVFMGDTGSLALGAALAGLALMGKQEIAFQGWAVVPWAEALSVIVQVVVFKVRRRQRGLEYAQANRVFRRTPLHHHFEEAGWPETRVVSRFWLITAVAAGVVMSLAGGR